jgi:hypothetical protein
LAFEDGSIGTIHYFANGDKGFPKERIEAFAGARILQLDNFQRLQGYGWRGFSSVRTNSQDKGQRDCSVAFLAAVSDAGVSALIPRNELFEVSRIAIDLR